MVNHPIIIRMCSEEESMIEIFICGLFSWAMFGILSITFILVCCPKKKVAEKEVSEIANTKPVTEVTEAATEREEAEESKAVSEKPISEKQQSEAVESKAVESKAVESKAQSEVQPSSQSQAASESKQVRKFAKAKDPNYDTLNDVDNLPMVKASRRLPPKKVKKMENAPEGAENYDTLANVPDVFDSPSSKSGNFKTAPTQCGQSQISTKPPKKMQRVAVGQDENYGTLANVADPFGSPSAPRSAAPRSTAPRSAAPQSTITKPMKRVAASDQNYGTLANMKSDAIFD